MNCLEWQTRVPHPRVVQNAKMLTSAEKAHGPVGEQVQPTLGTKGNQLGRRMVFCLAAHVTVHSSCDIYIDIPFEYKLNFNMLKICNLSCLGACICNRHLGHGPRRAMYSPVQGRILGKRWKFQDVWTLGQSWEGYRPCTLTPSRQELFASMEPSCPSKEVGARRSQAFESAVT